MGTRLVHLLFLSLLGVSLFSVVGCYKTPLLLASVSGDRHICIYVMVMHMYNIFYIERCIYRHSYGDNCSQREIRREEKRVSILALLPVSYI